jgi:hypothetical protein
MTEWSNIEVSPDDQEVLAIDRMERALGDIPDHVYKVRELITRFEVCHFKYRKHYRHITDSIAALHPSVNAENIGARHPRHGEDAVAHDTTGRSRTGQRYISALRLWLNNRSVPSDDSQNEMNTQVTAWLGERDNTKEKRVSMLLDRLLYRGLEEYSYGELEGIEYQVMATDICCYAFPRNIEKVIKGIGKGTPVKEFDGCGTVNAEIVVFITGEFKRLCKWLGEDEGDCDALFGKKIPEKVWLVACLTKTMKEQVRLSGPVPGKG